MMSRMKEINELLAELEVTANKAQAEKTAALEKAKKAEEDAKKAEDAKKTFEDVKKKGEAFEESYNNAMNSTGYNNVEDKKKNVKEKKSKNGNVAKAVIAGVLATTITLTGGHFIANAIKNAKNDKNNVDNNISNVQEYIVDEKTDSVLAAQFREFLENKGIIRIDEMSTGRIVVTPLVTKLTASEIEQLSDEFFKSITPENMHDNEELDKLGNDFCKTYLLELGITVDELDINNSIGNIATAAEDLTTEKFEELVVNFAKLCVDNNLSLSTEDLTKFVAIMNIDRLSEENPQLVEELFGLQSEEEFLNDAGKVIGNIYMYNHRVWETEKSTENFIWISEGISDNDPQKVKMQEIEEYVKRMAVAAANGDIDELNKIAAEFIEALTSPTGSLNSLDDGIEFAAQVYIAMINNSIGRNYLDKEYRDYFNVRSSAETNVSNIITVIRGCITEDKTRSLTK